MTELPERHPRIPKTASWSPDAAVWEDCALDEQGRRQGEYLSFRADGSLRQRCTYRAGVRSGPFTIYHPNGELAREGSFVEGAPDGRMLAYVSSGESSEGLRACCVPPNAQRLHAEYARGQVVSERFFDAEDRELLSNGSPVPARPSGLSSDAAYDEVLERWVTVRQEGALSIMKLYDAAGALVQEEAFEDSCRVRVRRFARDGALRSEEHFDRQGELQGTRFLRYADDEKSPYLGVQILEERSHFERGQAVAVAELVTAAGVRLCFDRGAAFEEKDGEHVVFSDERRDGNAWLKFAQELAESQGVRHAFIATARASARLGSAEPLLAWLARHVPAKLPEHAAELAAELGRPESRSVSAVLSALLLGAEPAAALTALAQLLLSRDRAAHDLIEAALLLSPDHGDAYAARAMSWLRLGNPANALADAERVARDSEALANFIRAYADVHFPRWRFVPADEAKTAGFEGLCETPAQPLANIQRLIGVYATRLLRLRQSALTHAEVPEPTCWLPPELPELLPNGPLDLASYEATIVDPGDGDEHEETSEVEIDEAFALNQLSLLEIQARARCDWAALCWLCWATGLARVAWPETLEPSSEFAAAASSAIARAVRIGDSIASGGFRARAAGLPDFEWEGMPIDALPGPLAKLAFDEYAELRALFLWLCFAENHSPFQSDLREQ